MKRMICGVDGCRAGWVCASRERPGGEARLQVFKTLDDLLVGQPPRIVAIDLPIGLPDTGERCCDVEARRLLGFPRCSSVFPAPIRPLLAATSHAEASQRRRDIEGRGFPIQAWGIVERIRCLDALLRRDRRLRLRVYEAHPEVCFYFMAGRRPMQHGKKTPDGRAEREKLLLASGAREAATLLAQSPGGCGADDVLDALATLWTAERILAGQAVTLPGRCPPRDPFGLPMRMLV